MSGFRPVTNADGETIRDLVFSVLAEYGLAPDPAGTDADLADLERHYAPPGAFEVLERDGVIIGCYGLYALDERVCELRKMYLKADCRGQGLGKRLLTRALDRAREAGFATMTLETASVLREALALYESFGFRPCARAHLAGRCDRALSREL